jgi:two-component system vancomycin resistance associated response regulator VraR
MDLMLQSGEGLELVGKVRAISDKVKVIILTETEDKKVYRRALEMGVNAFMGKSTNYSELISGILSVSKGKDIIPNFLMEENKNNSTILSEVETKVLKLIANEYTNDQIAAELFISRRTVEAHVASICRKLEVDSRIGAVREAIKLKLV